ncbi:MAG: Xaa-Pro peptidase family protein, partial [Clostridiales bacterium]|nr:Xaa-Pro peptidase family protein [Clostridiales bacterium]
MQRVSIPEGEYKERVKKAADLTAKAGLDVMVVMGTESDYANTRYFTGFWPLFERCGVAIAANGKSALMVGPESGMFAADVAKAEKIFVLKEFRESADPAYPELRAGTFADVFSYLGVKGDYIKIGLGSFIDFTLPVYNGLKENFPKADIVSCPEIMVNLRKIKSKNEIACLKEALRITEIATADVIRALRPGVTELEMVGIAQRAIYENGAEYEGLPMYVFSELSTRHAISRSSYREIRSGDIVQLNLSAKVDGYSPSIGLPVAVGKPAPEKRAYAEFALKAHEWTVGQLKSGVTASDIAKRFYQFYVDGGMRENYVYGPCHGMGLIEVEAPWMETISDYPLEENMVFNVDTFISARTFGVRWERGAVITKDGCE